MKDNYFYINGKKIPMSDETANAIASANKKLTFNDILESRTGSTIYHIDDINSISKVYNSSNCISNRKSVNTEQRAKQLQAITKLMICADYFNDKAEVYANGVRKWRFEFWRNGNRIEIISFTQVTVGIMFDNKSYAEETFRILGKDTIKLALTGH